MGEGGSSVNTKHPPLTPTLRPVSLHTHTLVCPPPGPKQPPHPHYSTQAHQSNIAATASDFPHSPLSCCVVPSCVVPCHAMPCHAMPCRAICVQVTSTAVRLVSASSGQLLTQWSPATAAANSSTGSDGGGGSSITLAAASPCQVLVAAGGGRLWLLQVRVGWVSHSPFLPLHLSHSSVSNPIQIQIFFKISLSFKIVQTCPQAPSATASASL